MRTYINEKGHRLNMIGGFKYDVSREKKKPVTESAEAEIASLLLGKIYFGNYAVI